VAVGALAAHQDLIGAAFFILQRLFRDLSAAFHVLLARQVDDYLTLRKGAAVIPSPWGVAP
jgi:hypothetical protein